MDQIKIGVCEFCFPCRGPIAIGMAHKAGFEGMQLSDCGGSETAFPFLNTYVQDCYLKSAEENGITFQAMHLQTLFNQKYMKESPKSEKGQLAHLSLSKGALACKEMGIATMMVTITQIMNKEQYYYSVENLKYALDECEKNGIRLSMENDLNSEGFMKLQKDVGAGLKMCFDTMNTVVNEIDYPEVMLQKIGLKVIDHFHVKDCVENEAGFMTKYTTPFVRLGQGKTHFQEWAALIRKLGYSGWVISENFYYDKSFAGVDYVEVASEDAETLKEVLRSPKNI